MTTNKNFERKQEYITSDRIDIQVFIEPVPIDRLADQSTGEPSAEIRQRVITARAIQTTRFASIPNIHTNAQMGSRLLRQYCRLEPQALNALTAAINKFQMSARAYDRILRVARSIADIDYAQSMTPEQAADAPILRHHIAEAIGYRAMDRASWGSTLP